jgi:hypothetical protein
LKPHTAPGRGRSRHLELPAKLPRETLNESQPGRSPLNRLQMEAWAIVFHIEKK